MELSLAKVEWHLVRGGEPYGPFSDLQMLNGIDAGHLRPDDQLWRSGFSGWRPAAVVFPELYYQVPKQSHRGLGDPIEVVDVEPLVYERAVERRARSRKALVLPLFVIVILGGAGLYGYSSADWLLSETANLLKFLAL